ncbi:retrovirus-related pol polyprotein from transposon TNT 1-94 [Tanacetum coccineum]|uniref:Retrovirus-related pol polyprotein from transposon TNT 1-94 n=1 Tax=Tanacetum coccineum TaxID=301880 RepID=A0ABQ4YQB5_9ASTR
MKNAREKCVTAYGLLEEQKVKSEKSSSAYTEKILSLNKNILELENELSAYKRTISTISFQKDEQEKVLKTREDKEIENIICLENQVKVLNDIVYKRGCYNDNLVLMLALESDETICLAQEIRSKLSEQKEYYYADHINAILGVYTTLDEHSDLACNYIETLEKCERLENELSKRTENVNNKSFNELSKRFSKLEQHLINLELALQQSQEQIKHDTVWKQKESSSFRELNEIFFEIQDLKAQLQDKNIAISELKKLIEKMKGKSMETKFEKPSVIRKLNAFKCQKQSIVGKPTTFSSSLEKKDFSKSRTKKPIVLPIRTREPKRKENQSVATPHRKTVTLEPTIKKHRSTFRKLYEHIVEIILFIIDSGSLKHMTGNLKLLRNSVEKFLGTVKFRNDQFALIIGYGYLVQGNVTIKRVYYVEGLNRKLFSVGQFCDVDLEVAFWKSTCYVRDLKGNDLLIGSRGTDLYSIPLQDTTSPNTICLMAKASSSQAWLWHHRLSHLNFDPINLLSKNDIVIGLPKLKFIKDHLCSSCELGKAKRKSFKTKTTPSSKRRLQLLHMDLYSPMRVESINDKKYMLVIVDDYSRYTWTHFFRSKDKTPKVLIDFLRLIQQGLHAQVRTVRTDKGMEFLNKTLHEYFSQEGIEHQTSIAQTPKQNSVVERQNRTLVETARTMLSAAKVPFQELIEYITRVIVETIHVNFDELPLMASDHVSFDPTPQCPTTVLEHDSLSPATQSQVNVSQAAKTVTISLNELDMLFSLMFDEYFTGATTVVSKSSVVPTVDASDKPPTQAPTITAIENNDQEEIQAEVHAENAHVDKNEFINLFSTPTRDHPLEQVTGNPSQPVRTRRQLETDGEMCMFALIVSRTEPKNIKEAMADHAWIEAM